jgi:uncharacterized protein YtpQ (UPF0354 family)
MRRATPVQRPEDVVPLIELARDGDVAPGWIAEPLAGDLVVTYAFDTPHGLTPVHANDLRRLNVGPEFLRMLAVGNLAQRVKQMECHEPVPQLNMLTCGGKFEASLLLLDPYWPQLAEQARIEGELVVAVPARDVVVFTGSRSRAGLAAMTECIASLHANPKVTHRLSRRMFARKDGLWRTVRTKDSPA